MYHGDCHCTYHLPDLRQNAIFSQKPGTDVMIFLNIFAEKFGEKIGVFDSKQS
jgi:hypothetical protein